MKKEEFLADEVLMIEDGGEMPEVAFNASLYYLVQDNDGPQLSLTTTDLLPLKEAVLLRFGFIILRDLHPENRTKSLYRGLERSSANWFRLVGYGQRESLSVESVRVQVVEALEFFLNTELYDVCVKGALSCINCSRAELQEYAKSLEVDLDCIARGWQKLF